MNETFKINIYFDEKGEEYVQKLGWNYQLIDTYIDQGFTGINFNRPDFQRMIKDNEKLI